MKKLLESYLNAYFFGIGITIIAISGLILALFLLLVFVPLLPGEPNQGEIKTVIEKEVAVDQPLPLPVRREPPQPLGEPEASSWIDCQQPEIIDDETIQYCEEKGEQIEGEE